MTHLSAKFEGVIHLLDTLPDFDEGDMRVINSLENYGLRVEMIDIQIGMVEGMLVMLAADLMNLASALNLDVHAVLNSARRMHTGELPARNPRPALGPTLGENHVEDHEAATATESR